MSKKRYLFCLFNVILLTFPTITDTTAYVRRPRHFYSARFVRRNYEDSLKFFFGVNCFWMFFSKEGLFEENPVELFSFRLSPADFRSVVFNNFLQVFVHKIIFAHQKSNLLDDHIRQHRTSVSFTAHVLTKDPSIKASFF